MDGWMMDTSPWMEVDTWNEYGVTHDAHDAHDAEYDTHDAPEDAHDVAEYTCRGCRHAYALLYAARYLT